MTCGIYIWKHISISISPFRFNILTQSLTPVMQTSTTSKLLVSDIASSVDRVPSSYIRQISDRPNISDVDIFGDSIPLIDLQELYGPSRANIIHQFAHACSSYSFFQVTQLFHFQPRSRFALFDSYTALMQGSLCFSRVYSAILQWTFHCKFA